MPRGAAINYITELSTTWADRRRYNSVDSFTLECIASSAPCNNNHDRVPIAKLSYSVILL
jgi:hypothetical protein